MVEVAFCMLALMAGSLSLELFSGHEGDVAACRSADSAMVEELESGNPS